MRTSGLLATSGCRILEITDGTSNTITLIEDAGRPFRFLLGNQLTTTSTYDGAGWVDRDNALGIAGYDKANPNKSPMFGNCAINCKNNNEAYSFHTGGAISVFADGSVHFIKDSIPILNFIGLVTRDGGEIPSSSDFN